MSNFQTILSQAPGMGHGFIGSPTLLFISMSIAQPNATVLEHDLYQQSVDLAVDFVLPMALSNPQLSIQPIIQCLGMDASQAYVETGKPHSVLHWMLQLMEVP